MEKIEVKGTAEVRLGISRKFEQGPLELTRPSSALTLFLAKSLVNVFRFLLVT